MRTWDFEFNGIFIYCSFKFIYIFRILSLKVLIFIPYYKISSSTNCPMIHPKIDSNCWFKTTNTHSEMKHECPKSIFSSYMTYKIIRFVGHETQQTSKNIKTNKSLLGFPIFINFSLTTILTRLGSTWVGILANYKAGRKKILKY